MNLEQLKEHWADTPEYHKWLNENFTGIVNGRPDLKEHRDWVESKIWGFGERSFWFVWDLICRELPERAKMLEVGVFKGATLSVWKLLKPFATVYGVTPLDSTGIGWEGDYLQMIDEIHARFEQLKPIIIHGLSESKEAIETATATAPYGVVYIDGGHEKHHIDNDMKYYAPLVEQGGYLVIDDACCDMKMPWGYFQGIQPVTDGVLEYMQEHGNDWEFITNVVHLRIFKRK